MTELELSQLVGKIIRIRGNKRPYWYRVEKIEPPTAEINIGHRVWVWGTPLLATGKPAKRQQPCDFIGLSNIIDVRP